MARLSPWPAGHASTVDRPGWVVSVPAGAAPIITDYPVAVASNHVAIFAKFACETRIACATATGPGVVVTVVGVAVQYPAGGRTRHSTPCKKPRPLSPAIKSYRNFTERRRMKVRQAMTSLRFIIIGIMHEYAGNGAS